MKKLILILFLFYSSIAFGQQDSGFTDVKDAKNLTINGLKEGKWVEFVNYEDSITTIDSNSAYFRLVVFKHGEPNGIVREYFYNGEPGNFYGSIFCESTYINGVENGIRSIYHMAGWLRDEIPITNNKENGLAKEYYENGNIRTETKYVNGKEISVKKYDESGNVIKQ